MLKRSLFGGWSRETQGEDPSFVYGSEAVREKGSLGMFKVKELGCWDNFSDFL